MVVSCDTVTNIDLFAMLNCFRQNNASIVAQLFKAGLEADTVVPGPKMKHKLGTYRMIGPRARGIAYFVCSRFRA